MTLGASGLAGSIVRRQICAKGLAHALNLFVAITASRKTQASVHKAIMLLLYPRCWRKQALLRRTHQPRGITSCLTITGRSWGPSRKRKTCRRDQGRCNAPEALRLPQQGRGGSCASGPAVTPTLWASICTLSVYPSFASWHCPPLWRALALESSPFCNARERTFTPLGSEKEAKSL